MMFLEELENERPLPRTFSLENLELREEARSDWDRFVGRLRKPTRLDAKFFLIVETDEKVTYLDQISWFEGNIAGRDALDGTFCRLPEDVAKETVVDYGFLENGLLRAGHWLNAVYLQAGEDDIRYDYLLPDQLEIPGELYDHYLAIARHDPAAIERIAEHDLAEVHQVPFEICSFHFEEFCPLGYAVAHGNLEYVQAAAGLVRFAECKSYDGHGLANLAVMYGSCTMLQAVLAGGGVINDLDDDSHTPLEIAVGGQKLDHLYCLLSHGADPNYGLDPDTTEVEHALSLTEMSLQTYELLRNSGARFDLCQTRYLWTPLHYNAKRFQRHTFIQMVRDGLNPHAEDYEGETPFEKIRKDVPLEIFQEVYRQCMEK